MLKVESLNVSIGPIPIIRNASQRAWFAARKEKSPAESRPGF